jgi:hypothetical protein
VPPRPVTFSFGGERRSILGRGLGVATFLLVTCMGCRPGTPNAEPVSADPASGVGPSGPPPAPVVVVPPAPRPAAADAIEWPEGTLAREITEWKKGTAAPPKLLRFPHRPPPDPMMCGLRTFGDSVDDYISRIADPDLLEALLLDPGADSACVQAAARRLLDTRGTKMVRAILAARQREWNRRPEVATLAQLLTASYARVKVAAIDKSDVEPGRAQSVLNGLKADLERGDPWARAYIRAYESLPDTRRGGTLIGYRYDGLISPNGFDLMYRWNAGELESAHVRALFAARGGTHIWESADAYWLYHTEAFDEQSPPAK